MLIVEENPWLQLALMVVSAVAALFSIFFAWLSFRASKKARESAEQMERERREIEERWRHEDRQLDEQRREEEKKQEEQRESRQRINRVVDDYYELAERNETGIVGLMKAGVTSLSSDSEVRKAAEICAARTKKHPFGGYAPLLEGLDSLKILLEWNSEQFKQGADFRSFLRKKREKADLPRVRE